MLGARLTNKGANQAALPHHTGKPFPASKAEPMPVQWQGSVTGGPHAGEWKGPGSKALVSLRRTWRRAATYVHPLL